MTKNMKPKKGLIIAISAGIVAIAVAVVAIVLILKRNNTVSIDSIESYCKSHNYGTGRSAGKLEEIGADETLMCGSEDDTTILAQTYKDNVSIADIEKRVSGDKSVDLNEIIGKGDNYRKYYSERTTSTNKYYSYSIIEGKIVVAVIATDEKDAKRIIVELGFPDKDWRK